MMRITILSLIICLLAMPLVAAVLPSNSIAQITEKESSWTLEETILSDGKTQQILFDGTEKIQTITVDHLTRIIEDHLNQTVRTYEYQGYSLVKETTVTPTISTGIIYKYHEGKLHQLMLLEHDTIIGFVQFYRLANGSLAAVRRVLFSDEPSSVFEYFSSTDAASFWYAKGSQSWYQRIYVLPGNVTVQDYWIEGEDIPKPDITLTDDGSFTIVLTTAEGKILGETTYNDSGQIIKEITNNELEELVSEINYFYEAGKLVRKEQNLATGIQHISFYTDGVLTREQIFDNGLLSRSSQYTTTSRIDTIFDEGKAVAIITYTLDGRRVLSVEYL